MHVYIRRETTTVAEVTAEGKEITEKKEREREREREREGGAQDFQILTYLFEWLNPGSKLRLKNNE